MANKTETKLAFFQDKNFRVIVLWDKIPDVFTNGTISSDGKTIKFYTEQAEGRPFSTTLIETLTANRVHLERFDFDCDHCGAVITTIETEIYQGCEHFPAAENPSGALVAAQLPEPPPEPNEVKLKLRERCPVCGGERNGFEFEHESYCSLYQ